MECIFCQIVKKNIPAEIFYEDDKIIAFSDIRPIALIHILIIPKTHIKSVTDISEDDTLLMGKLIFTAKIIAERNDIAKKGYKLLFRVGKEGGQEVQHIHLHLLGGKAPK
ncbi:histidine triad nucleotide-binding protein [Patescibacteria group bacterium]|nr:histidine triad nucleotide-binding protein [Patescibacteria group bacterium]